MTGKERIRAVMEGRPVDRPPVSLYISWPEYGWRLLDKPVWEVILGSTDGIEAMDRVLARHPTDFASGPVDTIGSGWLRNKTLIREDAESAVFRCDNTGQNWRFDLRSHSLIPIDGVGEPVFGKQESDEFSNPENVPHSIEEADTWFAEHVQRQVGAPSCPPLEDRAVARWGKSHFMVTCTLGPFVAVAYAFGYESSMALLADRPQVFAHLASLYLQHFAAHYEWAAKAGYDGGHMVESWCSADTISPGMYRDWIAPIHRDAAQMIKSTGLKADLYLPGYCMPLLGYLRGQGWDALRIDDLCRGKEQDIAEARSILGEDQCLFGNMSSYALLQDDWEDIAARASYQYESAGKNSHFIISNGSGICDQTDPHAVDRWLDYAMKLNECFHGPSTVLDVASTEPLRAWLRLFRSTRQPK
jgi:hypothetical protein